MNADDDRAQPGPGFLRIDTREEFTAAVESFRREAREIAATQARRIAADAGAEHCEAYFRRTIEAAALAHIDAQAALLEARHFGSTKH